MNATELLSLPGLARRVDCDAATIRTRLAAGELAADFVVTAAGRGAMPLFRPDRVAEVLRSLEASRGFHSPAEVVS